MSEEKDILKALLHSVEVLGAKIDGVQSDIHIIKQTLNVMNENIDYLRVQLDAGRWILIN
jgi:hypothetical protein